MHQSTGSRTVVVFHRSKLVIAPSHAIGLEGKKKPSQIHKFAKVEFHSNLPVVAAGFVGKTPNCYSRLNPIQKQFTRRSVLILLQSHSAVMDPSCGYL